MNAHSGMNVVATQSGRWLVQRADGRIVSNIVFLSRESAEDCLPDTLHAEWDASEIVNRGA